MGLYLDPARNAIVLCVDETSQIQALNRTQPMLPVRPGLPEKATHDYKRSGSWLNLVEVFFGIITRQAIRRGSFESVTQLNSRPRSAPSSRRVAREETVPDSIREFIRELCEQIAEVSRDDWSTVVADQWIALQQAAMRAQNAVFSGEDETQRRGSAAARERTCVRRRVQELTCWACMSAPLDVMRAADPDQVQALLAIVASARAGAAG